MCGIGLVGGYSEQPSVAVNGNIVYTVWRETKANPFSDEIFYRRSTDGGAAFSQSTNLSNSAGISGIPVIVASGNNIYVVWVDSTSPINDNLETVLRRSTDNGATFGSVVNLSNSNFIHSGTIFIAASGNNVYIVWGEHGPGAIIEMLFRRSTDNGATFENIVNLSNNDGESTDCCLE